MFAASLWAADGLIRADLTSTIPSISIVFYEHLIAFLFLSPILYKSFKKFKKLKVRDWAYLILLALVSGVLGTVLFTEAFARSAALYDFATPNLLQKLQPIIVISLSTLFLREKLSVRFIGLVVLALIGSYMISFGTEGFNLSLTDKEAVFALSIGAAICWGSGTILSKHILEKIEFFEVAALRFLIAIPIAFIFMLAMQKEYSPCDLKPAEILRFAFIAVSTGAVSILIYYRGLKNTQAKISSIAELTYPIIAILIAVTSLNPFGEPQQLTLANVFGITILLISILLVSFIDNNNNDNAIEEKNKGRSKKR